jgi:hypothetical protein
MLNMILTGVVTGVIGYSLSQTQQSLISTRRYSNPPITNLSPTFGHS